MMRLSVTDLESYRYWKSQEDAPLAALLSDLRHESRPSSQMVASRAFHRLLERLGGDDLLDVDTVVEDGQRWSFVVVPDVDLPAPVARELKAEYVVQTSRGPVTLVGRIDALDARGAVHDYKLTERWDAEKYLDSLQWRAYLVLFGAERFVYDVFVGRYDLSAEGDGGVVTVTEHHALEMCSYPRIVDDVRSAVDELADVIARFLPEQAAAAGE